MTNLDFTEVIDCDLVASEASDLSVVNAARISFDDEHPELAYGDEKLIGFLLKNRHGSPFEHGFFKFRVQAPIFAFREHHRHRVGHCLPGDALITTHRNNDSAQRPISELWELANVGVKDSIGRTRLLPSCQHPSLRVLADDGEFRTAEAAEVYQSGVKSILKIEHERGVLRCTADHRIYTADGWKRAGDLTSDDLLGSVGRVWREEERSIPPSLRAGIGVWTTMQRRHIIQGTDLCYKCGESFPFDELELDHVVPVKDDLTMALDVNNLRPCCVTCHAHKTFTEEQPSRKGQGRLGVIPSKVLRVEADGDEMTYDIAMSGDLHNFVANGVVVHNSYNEMSGRYTELEPKFYVPTCARIQEGKPGAYVYVEQDPNDELSQFMRGRMHHAYSNSWATYQNLLDAGVAKEQARMVLPVGIYSKMIWSCNPRSLMHFLGLRGDKTAQKEIRLVAEASEKALKEAMPITYDWFIANGRTAP